MENEEIISFNKHEQQQKYKQSLKAVIVSGGCLGRAKAIPLLAILPLELWSTKGTCSGFRPELPPVSFGARLWVFFLALGPDLAFKHTAILTALLSHSLC